MIRSFITRALHSRYPNARLNAARSLLPTYSSRVNSFLRLESTLTSPQVRLPAGKHWHNDPESLEDCRDEFLFALTGVEEDINNIVKPLLYFNNGGCNYLVEYPAGSCEYYIYGGISDEIFRIEKPTQLDDIIDELGKRMWKGIRMENTRGEDKTKIVWLDEWERRVKELS
ncbi:MAG: hypothetical protein Q9192_004855 [Flavoplaca navasiana]